MKRFAQIYFKALFVCIIAAVAMSLVYAESDLSLDERIAIVEKKIERGYIRGDLTKNEYSRLKPRLAAMKYKRSKTAKTGVTEQSYRDLDRMLLGLEKDTERLSNSFKRR